MRVHTATQTGAGELVQEVLDLLPVTDNVFHHLAFTRPLVDALVDEVRRSTTTGRVLVIGPNELLPQVLTALGYEVDLWLLDGMPLSEAVQRLASRRGPLDELLRAPAGRPADVVVVPYAAEAAELEPAPLLRVLGGLVRPGGHVIIACRQPGELRLRLRRALRQTRSTTPPAGSLAPSPTWPTLAARRLLTSHDLAGAGAGRFRMVRSTFTTDHRPFIRTDALSVRKWLQKKVLNLAKVVVPGFRDCTLVTLVLVGGGPPELDSAEIEEQSSKASAPRPV